MSRYVTTTLLLIILAGCQSPSDSAAPGDAPQYGVVSLNAGWQYLENNPEDPGTALQLEGWTDIELPHTWNATDTVDAVPGYRRDASWYRKVLPPATGERQVLYFEGANMETDVFVNSQPAGRHVGGYVGFNVEITDYLRPDDDNLLMVRVSNAYNPNLIPSQKSDLFIHGGITRDVWL